MRKTISKNQGTSFCVVSFELWGLSSLLMVSFVGIYC